MGSSLCGVSDILVLLVQIGFVPFAVPFAVGYWRNCGDYYVLFIFAGSNFNVMIII